MKTITIAFFGDLVGEPGRLMLKKYLPQIRQRYAIDAVLVNGENSDNRGRGISRAVMQFFKDVGVDIVTSGNHIFQQKDIFEYLKSHKDLLRPENFPTECPGSGITLFQAKGYIIGVLNLQGRVFMREQVADPFKTADSALTFLKSRTPLVIVDFHAETTSEKIGLGLYLDGRVSAVVGTHTHVQTADERILPQGTAYITDLGMGGALNSMIGMQKESILTNMITQMPQKFEVDLEGPYVLSGVVIKLDAVTGKALSIERIRYIDEAKTLQEL